MVCIYCGNETKVTNSRHQKRTNSIWRRRECVDCEAVFTTQESADLWKGLLVTSGKHVEPFSRDKLFLSVHDAIRHRKSALNDATGLTDTVLSKLLPQITAASLSREQITSTTLIVLKNFDRAAATAYSAFHPLQG